MITSKTLEFRVDRYESEAEKLERRARQNRHNREKLVSLAGASREKRSEVKKTVERCFESGSDSVVESSQFSRLTDVSEKFSSLSRKFEQWAEEVTDSTSVETGGDGFYGDIHCDSLTFEDPLDSMLKHVESGFLSGVPIDAVLAKNGMYTNSLFETAPTSVNNSHLVFVFRDYYHSKWTKQVDSASVGIEGDELAFWGPLAEPLKTDDPAEMAAHIEEEVIAARERFDFVCEIEKLGSREPLRKDDISECSYEEVIDTHRVMGAISVKGVGDKSIKRMAKIYR